MTVQFATGHEPLAIARGRLIKAWLHARIDDTAALSSARRSDVVDWLAGLGFDAEVHLPRLVVSRDEKGHHHVHLYRAADDGVVEVRHPVTFGELPVWLREPTPEETGPARKATRARRGR